MEREGANKEGKMRLGHYCMIESHNLLHQLPMKLEPYAKLTDLTISNICEFANSHSTKVQKSLQYPLF